MAQKKVYHLKKKVKIILIIIFLVSILTGVGVFFGVKSYREKEYKNSYEYKFLEKGYKDNEVKIFLNNLDNKQLDVLLEKKYDEFIPFFIECKYFMFDKLDEYLTMVIHQEDNFFKYHGTEGYDYDNLVSLVNSNAYKLAYENDIDVDLSKNYSIIVNKYYKLSSDYEPEDLVDFELKYYYGDKKKIRKDVYDAYIEMFNAAKEDGFYLLILGAYRSYKEQETTYNRIADKLGVSSADKQSARPGYSEHQTGLALDIYSKECTNSKTFHESKTYEWLMNNAYKYGFILRYPNGKKKITGFDYESYHFRYVGVDLANKIRESGLTLEEYYAYYLE